MPSKYIQSVPYHNDKPGTEDMPVYDGPKPKFFFNKSLINLEK